MATVAPPWICFPFDTIPVIKIKGVSRGVPFNGFQCSECSREFRVACDSQKKTFVMKDHSRGCRGNSPGMEALAGV